MRSIYGLFFLFIAAVSVHVTADGEQRLAESAALSWLAKVDGGDFQESWEDAATRFKGQVSAKQWEAAVATARKPLGDLKSREHLKATFATSLPGVPDGEYMVLEFRSTFERKAKAIETLTLMLDGGTWRVSGYYIR